MFYLEITQCETCVRAIARSLGSSCASLKRDSVANTDWAVVTFGQRYIGDSDETNCLLDDYGVRRQGHLQSP